MVCSFEVVSFFSRVNMLNVSLLRKVFFQVVVVLLGLGALSCRGDGNPVLGKTSWSVHSKDQFIKQVMGNEGAGDFLYLQQEAIRECESDPESCSEVIFIFSNNPFGLDERYDIAIVQDGFPLYFGPYSEEVKVRIPDIKTAHFRVYALEKNINGYDVCFFDKKDVFEWDVDYNIVYICFFPFNESTEMIGFFPQRNYLEAGRSL